MRSQPSRAWGLFLGAGLLLAGVSCDRSPSPTQAPTPPAAVVADSRERLAAKDATIAQLRERVTTLVAKLADMTEDRDFAESRARSWEEGHGVRLDPETRVELKTAWREQRRMFDDEPREKRR